MNSVVLGLSGGVDSSVSAYLLKKAGFKVVAVTLKLYDNFNCNSAKEIAGILGIEHVLIDKSELFFNNVIQYFVSTYSSGRTPNPCVVCNRLVKFYALNEFANSIEASYIATGHYARIENGILKKATHQNKDQSYFLYNLKKELLPKIIFPLGEKSKQDVREIAKNIGLHFEDIKESADICFVKCQKYQNMIANNVRFGNIINEQNVVIGQHNGIHNYTIGQRKGIGISSKNPLYVKKIDAEKNEITISEYNGLSVRCVFASSVNLLKEVPQQLLGVDVKFRYSQKSTVSDVLFSSDFTSCVIKLKSLDYAVAAGQSCVFYDGDTLLGGGVIDRVE